MGFYINIDEQMPTRCLQCPMYLNMYECIWIGRDQFDKNGKMIKCPLKSNKKDSGFHIVNSRQKMDKNAQLQQKH